MKRTTVVRLRGMRFADAVSRNKTLIIMLAAFVLGVVLGTLQIKHINSGVMSQVAEKFAGYLSVRRKRAFFPMLLSSCKLWLPYFIVAFLCGTSLVGVAVTPPVIGCYGYIYGILSAYLYKTYSLAGVGFLFLIVLPARVISSFGMLLSGRESLDFSFTVAKVTLQSSSLTHAYTDFKNYCLHNLIILILLIVSSLIDCLFAVCFIRFFGF